MTDAAKQRQEGLASAVRAHGAGSTERPPHAPPPSRECDECTHCCSGVLRLEVDGEVIRPGHGCHHCQTSGCGIYASRPAVCRDFVCGWLRDDSALPPWLRPDSSGMILLPAYRRWCGVPVDVAVAAGTRRTARGAALAQTLFWSASTAVVVSARDRRTLDRLWPGGVPRRLASVPGTRRIFVQIIVIGGRTCRDARAVSTPRSVGRAAACVWLAAYTQRGRAMVITCACRFPCRIFEGSRRPAMPLPPSRPTSVSLCPYSTGEQYCLPSNRQLVYAARDRVTRRPR